MNQLCEDQQVLHLKREQFKESAAIKASKAPSNEFTMTTPQKWEYDGILEKRAVKHRNLGDRKNVTTCRSPPRDPDMKSVKNELQRKRHDEFSKRRPADCGMNVLLSSRTSHVYSRKEVHVTQTSTLFRQPFTASPINSSLKQSMFTSSLNDENGLKRERVVSILESIHQRGRAKKERAVFGDITQATNNHRTLHSASVQTESDNITVKETDVQQLAIYLEESLYREEALKKKLASLQNSTSTLLRTTELLWKTRCDEDLLKSKIKALEAQLQLCMKDPQDGLKKVVLKMEKQKEEYEQKALQVIQKTKEENTEAQSKMHNLQEALQAAQAESVRWQKLYEELRESSNLLRTNQDQVTEQLLQLQNQLERSRGEEESLREQYYTLQKDEEELRTAVILLEQDNQSLREQLEALTNHGQNSWNNITEVHKQGQGLHQVLWTDNSIADQLHRAEQRLNLKEKECVELKTELEILEQECYSYQTRLAKCREELNTLNAHKSRHTSKKRSCGSIFCLCMFFVLMLIAAVAMICVYRPSVMEQVNDFCAVVVEKVEDYLVLAASAQHASCLRPI